jgi:hypothetical protein
VHKTQRFTRRHLRCLGPAHACGACKMERLTPGDFSGIANKQDLITSVEERCNLSHAAAVQDVQIWGAGVRGAWEATAGSLAQTEWSA